ncbi:MAG: DoxX family protein [Acidobacteriota bacterium]
MLQKITDTSNDFAPTIARLFAGLVMLPHGLQKTVGAFGGSGFEGTMQFFTETAGLPYAAALLVIAGESLGALGLIFGALARPAAFGFVAIMTGAALIHLENGFFMNWFGTQEGEGFEYHLLMIGLALIVLIKGAGAFSIDRLIANRTS